MSTPNTHNGKTGSSPPPALVIHGISNRDPNAFRSSVAALQSRLDNRMRLIGVYWGDLGGISDGLTDALPDLFGESSGTRGAELGAEEAFVRLLNDHRLEHGEFDTRSGDVADALYGYARGASPSASDPDAQFTRGEEDALREALRQTIPQTRYLQHLHDPRAQARVGELLADYAGLMPHSGIETRGWVGDLHGALVGYIERLDAAIGSVAADIAGSANQWARARSGPAVALTLGDIVAYHQARAQIHQRLFETLDREAPGWGTAEKPITVLAHSLGGLVAIDAVLGAELPDGSVRTLHIDHWVTFGSQPAFFHVLAPRRGLARYAKNQPATLPASVRRWTNLWHPMDLLAFTAGTVFRLADGNTPTDRKVETPASELVENYLWTHSVYWESAELQQVFRT
jgi:hypothetical protein